MEAPGREPELAVGEPALAVEAQGKEPEPGSYRDFPFRYCPCRDFPYRYCLCRANPYPSCPWLYTCHPSLCRSFLCRQIPYPRSLSNRGGHSRSRTVCGHHLRRRCWRGSWPKDRTCRPILCHPSLCRRYRGEPASYTMTGTLGCPVPKWARRRSPLWRSTNRKWGQPRLGKRSAGRGNPAPAVPAKPSFAAGRKRVSVESTNRGRKIFSPSAPVLGSGRDENRCRLEWNSHDGFTRPDGYPEKGNRDCSSDTIF